MQSDQDGQDNGGIDAKPAVAVANAPPGAVDPAMESAHQLESTEDKIHTASTDVEAPQRPLDAEVYDPTPVIRGYDVTEGEPSQKPQESPTASEPRSETKMPEDELQGEAVPASLVPSEIPTPAEAPTSPVEEAQAVPETAVEESKADTEIQKTMDFPHRGPQNAVSSSVSELPTSAEPIDAVQLAASRAKPLDPVVDPLTVKVRETWSLMFSSRYEDEDDNVSADPHDGLHPTKASHFTADTRQSSLRAKLDRERRLAEQIQGSRIHSQRRPDQVTKSTQGVPQATTTRTSRRRPKPAGWLEEDHPFEDAGLLPTAVRFCMEKAMLQAVQCLGELHAIAQDEPKPVSGDIALGVFMAQWELNHILEDLFADQTTTPTSAAETKLRLHNPEYASLPLETLLRVSWFLPLDQLTRLRLLVAEISRKRLSEAKLAILNAALHRHFVLRPYPGVRMQRLLLRIVQALVGKTNTNQDEERDEVKSSTSSHLVVELLHALHIRIPPAERENDNSVASFMLLNPTELASRYQLSSMVTIQRVVYFRFFIEALTAQQVNQTSGTNAWWPRSTGKPRRLSERRSSEPASESSTPLRTTSKRKKKPQRPPLPESQEPENSVHANDDDGTDGRSDLAVSASSAATHGSAGSPHPQPSAAMDSTKDSVPSQDDEAFMRLKSTLTEALTSLVRTNPWLVESQEAPENPSSPTSAATRATFLAAETFQQSLTMLSSTAPVAQSVPAKMEEFTKLLTSLATRPIQEAVVEPTDPPPGYGLLDEPHSEPSKPTPRRVQRANSGSFPPPYVSTKPAYWTFEPEMPTPSSPAASIPKSISKAKASPGVGDYDVRRSDRLTFQQRAGHSFSRSGLAPLDEVGEKKPVAATPTRRPSTSTTRAVKGSDSASSLEPPTYTHWASAAEDTTRDAEDEDGTNEPAIDDQVRDALRLQQSFQLDDLVQSLLHRGQPTASTRYTRSTQPRMRPSDPRPTSASNAKIERPGPTTSRVVSRVRTITTARAPVREQPEGPPKQKTRARSLVRPPPPYAPTDPQPSPVKQPPRDYEPPADDGHLQWAARVSEFYKAQLQAAEGR